MQQSCILVVYHRTRRGTKGPRSRSVTAITNSKRVLLPEHVPIQHVCQAVESFCHYHLLNCGDSGQILPRHSEEPSKCLTIVLHVKLIRSP